MSRTRPDPFERLELAEVCNECHADPEDWCVARSGRWAERLHALRWYAAKRTQARLRSATAPADSTRAVGHE